MVLPGISASRVGPSVALKGFLFMEPLIRVNGLHYTYRDGSDKIIPALNGVDLTVNQGEFIAIIGSNGSGKSTLVRHFNGLLLPTEGEVQVNGKNTCDPT